MMMLDGPTTHLVLSHGSLGPAVACGAWPGFSSAMPAIDAACRCVVSSQLIFVRRALQSSCLTSGLLMVPAMMTGTSQFKVHRHKVVVVKAS